ncbi:hypothetical protein BVY02_01480, partial [bacterium J17]
MFEQISIQTIIDSAFVGFVVYTCWRSLSSSPEKAVANLGALNREYQSNEMKLKELIGEAGATGRNLERRLSKRKEELEKLLEELAL